MAWQELENIKARLDLPILSDLSIENLLGAKDKIEKIELAMKAEFIHKLMSKGGTEHCAKQKVKAVLKVIMVGETLETDVR